MTYENNLPPSPAPPLPAAQDAGQIAVETEDLQTHPPQVPLPLTSSTGTGFNTLDAGTEIPAQSQDPLGNTPIPSTEASPLPVSNDKQEATEGDETPSGSEVNAEAISSPGPVSDGE